MTNKRLAIYTLILVLITWFILGTFLSDHTPPLQKPDRKPMRVQVIKSTAQNRTIYYTLQGYIEALNKVHLRAEVSGIVKNILAEQGDILEKGQPIINLSFESRLSKLREAEALVAQRQLEFNNAKRLNADKFRSTTSVAEAQSKLKAAEAVLELAQNDIEETTIRAPFNGYVDKRLAQTGDYVNKGDPLVQFIAFDPLSVIVHVSEQVIHKIKMGTTAKITIQGTQFEGAIIFISHIADPKTRTYRVDIRLHNPDRLLLSDGLTATVALPIRQGKAHVVSPAVLAMDDAGVPGVKLVGKGNQVYFKPIDILNHDADGIALTGLPDTVYLITVGQYFVNPGDTVEPVMEKASSQPKPSLKPAASAAVNLTKQRP